MAARVLAGEGCLELLHQLALFNRQVDRSFNDNAAIEVAWFTAAHRLDAFVAQAENAARLRFGRNPNLRLAAKRWHPYGIAQRRLRDADRHVAMQVITVALENGMRAHAHFDVKIAWRRSRRTRFALARQAHAIAVVDARRNLHREDFFFLDPAGAMAGLAWRGDRLAAAATVRAWLLHGEDAALHAHLAMAMACRTGVVFSVLGSGRRAGATPDQRRDLDALFRAGDGVLEVELHHVADVGAATRTAPLCTATKNIAEDVAEDIAHVTESGAWRRTTGAVFERGMSMRVIQTALGRIRQDFVGLLALLERLQCNGVVGIAVRVVLHRAAAIGLLQVFIRGISGDAQGFVVIALAHETVIPLTQRRAGLGPARHRLFDIRQACLPSSPLTSVNSASTTSSPPASPDCGPDPPPAPDCCDAANNAWPASSNALDLASICVRSSPFMAVSSSSMAPSARPMTSPPTLSPLSLMALRVA